MQNETKKTKTTSNEVPPAEPNSFTTMVSKDEIVALIQLLAFSREVYAEMALNFLKDGKQEEGKIANERSLASSILCDKFKKIALIGEPESRQLH